MMTIPALLETKKEATISVLHPDLLYDVLHRLDGTTLASMSCAATEFRAIAGDQSLWQRLVTTSWPATADSDVRSLIASFPGGFRSFYADAYPLVSPSTPLLQPVGALPAPDDLISVVDIFYYKDVILSKVVRGIGLPESSVVWFHDAPFRLDALERKDDPPVIIVADGDRSGEEICRLLANGIRMSWIVMDVKRGRAVNLTGWAPLEVERRWYSEMEYLINFGTVLPLDKETIYCGVSVKCGACEGGALKMREVAMMMEDKEGSIFLGRDSLDIIQKALGGQRRKGGEWLKEKYEEFVRVKREIKESKSRREKRVDMACVLSGVTLFVAFIVFIITPR